MKKTSKRQVDKLFNGISHDLYDKFIENVTIIYSNLFPDKCSSKTWDDHCYDIIRERLIIEFGVLYTEARGEKNAQKKCKVAAKRTVV